MSSEPSPSQVADLFQRTLDLPGEQRLAFLDGLERAGSSELVHIVRDMLKDMESGIDGFLETPVAAALGMAAGDSTGSVPDAIGPYRVLRRLGEGGFGTVYLAEQALPVRRQVAIKMLRDGFASQELHLRFSSEIQALSCLDHPGVARVFDAGAIDTGRPYVVMEYVDGVPLTEHCDRERLDTRERLTLFLEVLAAVQHAHQRGVIHRDLKPSNILVTQIDASVPNGAVMPRGAPKVIDFGTAKAIRQSPADRPFVTLEGQLLGTPEYMSPEQAAGAVDEVDTRSDVYSLGVLLYQLLCGKLPFDSVQLRAGSLLDMARRIRDLKSVPPSVRVVGGGLEMVDAAKQRGATVAVLAHQIRGDLDWIASKAIEKDPAQRYATVSEFAADIRRHLCHEPVLAGPPSLVLRARKFLRRYRVMATATAAVVLTLMAGLAVSLWLYAEADDQRSQAEAARTALENESQAKDAALTQARGLHLATQAMNVLDSDPSTALLLAVRAYDEMPSVEARSALVRILPAHRERINLSTFEAPRGPRMTLSSSPDGQRLLACGRRTARIAAVADAQDLGTIHTQMDIIAAWFADRAGTRFSALSPDGMVVTYLIETGAVIGKLDLGYPRTAWARVVDSDEESVKILTSSGRTIRRWQITPRSLPDKVELVLPEDESTPIDGFLAALHEPSATLAVARRRSEIAIFRLPQAGQDKLLEVKRFQAPGNRMAGLTLSPDGRWLAAAIEEAAACIWNMDTGVVVSTLRGHDAEVGPLTWIDDTMLATGSEDRTARLWSVMDGSLVMSLRGNQHSVTALTPSPDGALLWTSSGWGELRGWEVRRHAELEPLRHGLAIVHADFSPDGTQVVTASRDRTARIWSLEDVRQFVELRGHADGLVGALFNHDASEVITAGWDATLRRWRARTGELLGTETLPNRPNRIARSRDGKQVIVAGEGYSTVHEAATLQRRGACPGRLGPLHDAAFSPDGRILLTASQQSTVTLWAWDGAKIDKVVELKTEEAARAARFSPDGRWFVTADQSGAVTLWDAATHRQVWSVKGSKAELHADFSPDSAQVLAATSDGVVHVREAASGKEILRVPAHSVSVRYAVYSPDGRYFLTTSLDGTARLLHADPLSVARSRRTRQLSAEELRAYGLDAAPTGSRTPSAQASSRQPEKTGLDKD